MYKLGGASESWSLPPNIYVYIYPLLKRKPVADFLPNQALQWDNSSCMINHLYFLLMIC